MLGVGGALSLPMAGLLAEHYDFPMLTGSLWEVILGTTLVGAGTGIGYAAMPALINAHRGRPVGGWIFHRTGRHAQRSRSGEEPP